MYKYYITDVFSESRIHLKKIETKNEVRVGHKIRLHEDDFYYYDVETVIHNISEGKTYLQIRGVG